MHPKLSNIQIRRVLRTSKIATEMMALEQVVYYLKFN